MLKHKAFIKLHFSSAPFDGTGAVPSFKNPSLLWAHNLFHEKTSPKLFKNEFFQLLGGLLLVFGGKTFRKADTTRKTYITDGQNL